jgi:hypothetical protein
MRNRIGLLLIAATALLTGCAQPRALGPNDPGFSTVEFLKERDAAPLSQMVLVPSATTIPASPDDRPVLPYRAEKVWAYVIRYAPGGNDCPEGQYDSDCAHFQSHALAAAGIKIDAPTAVCKAGLGVRVKDLAMAFDNASRRYENVKKFSDYHQARRGDFCFLPRMPGALNDHMMLLAATPDEEGAFVWSHTNNRTGTHAPFDPTRCVFYRIEDR